MWFALALVAALCQVLRNTVMKRLGHSLDEYINVWGRFTFLLPFAAIFVLWNGVPPVKPGFVLACVTFGICQTISTMALSKALKLAEISMVTALWKVSLLVLVVLGYFTLKETPTVLGVTGILVSMAGVYLLNVNRAHLAWWAPLAGHFAEVPRYWKAFVSFGLFAALTTISQGKAYLLTLSSYVEAVKQVEILFALGIGVAVFGERQKVRDIAPGAVVMLAGVTLLSLAA